MVHGLWVASVGGIVLSAFACSASEDGSAEERQFGTGGSGNGGASGSTSGGAGGVATGGSGGLGTGGTLIATGGSAGAGSSGCSKLDFLFVVDNSVSMEDQQAALVASFPGFVAAIESTVQAGSDYHVMVVDTDEWGRCNTANGWVGIDPGSDTCNAYIKSTTFEECDRTLGAGVKNPAGAQASNAVCFIPDGRRYFQQGDPQINDNFACTAKVGTAGHSSERPMDAMVAALAPAINATGGCNAGFLRDDAVLVITFISDDPNYEDGGTPQTWYDAVVAAKHGNPKAVVMLGLTPAFPTCPGAGTIKGAHWAEFVAKFPNSLHESVCSTDFSPIFTQAVGIIDTTCDEFEPPR
jgi:hypothetical protein